jgi:helix-turn-helix protein
MRLDNRLAEFGDDALLSEVQVSDLLFISVRTLQTWRSQGSGPAFVRAGRAIRYRRGDLLGWVAANRVVPSPARPKTDDVQQ